MFYQSKPFTCSYYNDREARYILFYMDEENSPDELKVTTNTPQNQTLSNQLTFNGFRRNNTVFYRPHCQDCQECQSLRVNVEDFIWKKRFKRIVKANQDLQCQLVDAYSSEEHFTLFSRYQRERHTDGIMNYPSIEQYHANLIVSPVKTKLLECRLNDTLVAVAITDIIDDGLSATYTYFDPGYPKRSLGTFAILKQLQYCMDFNKPWLYLGYWLTHNDKMQYKTNFTPYQLFTHNQWRNT